MAKYKDWASKNQDAAFVSAIEVTFDPSPLATGCELPPDPPPLPPAPPRAHHPAPRALATGLTLAAALAPSLQSRRRRGDWVRRQDQPEQHAAFAPDARLRDTPPRAPRTPLRLTISSAEAWKHEAQALAPAPPCIDAAWRPVAGEAPLLIYSSLPFKHEQHVASPQLVATENSDPCECQFATHLKYSKKPCLLEIAGVPC